MKDDLMCKKVQHWAWIKKFSNLYWKITLKILDFAIAETQSHF